MEASDQFGSFLTHIAVTVITRRSAILSAPGGTPKKSHESVMVAQVAVIPTIAVGMRARAMLLDVLPLPTSSFIASPNSPQCAVILLLNTELYSAACPRFASSCPTNNYKRNLLTKEFGLNAN